MAEAPVAKVRSRLLRGTLLSPGVIVPGVLGAAGLASAAVLQQPLWGLGALALVLGSLGLGLTRWINVPEEKLREAVASVRAEGAAERRKRLDALIKRLQQDKDPRPETYLGQLLALEDAIKEMGQFKGLSGKLQETLHVDTRALVDRSVAICEETIELHLAHARMQSRDTRRIVDEQREAKVAELLACVAELEAVLHEILSHGEQEDRQGALDIREKLRRNLQAARDIDEKTREDEAGKLEVLRQRYRPDQEAAGGADGPKMT